MIVERILYKKLRLLFILLVAVIFVACSSDHNLDSVKHRISINEIIEESWFEIASLKNTDVPGSFVVFLNQSAVEWVSGSSTGATGAKVLKLNHIQIIPNTSNKSAMPWQGWRLELAQLETRNGLNNWAFYSFGPAEDLAASSVIQRQDMCSNCHERIGWRNAPLFFDLYLHEVLPAKRQIKVEKIRGFRQLTLL